VTLYRSKPSIVEAIQWIGDNDKTTSDPTYVKAVMEFAPGKVRFMGLLGRLELFAGKDGAQEWVPVPLGHWLVNQPGDKTDIWPVDPDYFAAKYELSGEDK
jgi:hypothetical protein